MPNPRDSLVRNEKIRQMRFTDPDGEPLYDEPAYPLRAIPPQYYAVPDGFYGGMPPTIGTDSPALGAILRGGIGAPHEATIQDLVLEAIRQRRQKIADEVSRRWRQPGKQ